MSLSDYFVKKMVGMAADAIEDALTGDKDDKDKDKDDEGGFFSSFKKDKKKKEDDDDDKPFSFGGGKKKDEDDDKGGFFSKIFKRDDDHDDDDVGKEKKSGFAGLFTEQAAGEAVAQGDDEGQGIEIDRNTGVSDGDLLSDLMEIADETSKGN